MAQVWTIPQGWACHRRPYETFVELSELVDLHVHDDHADAQAHAHAHARVLATSANGGSMKIPCPVVGVSIMDMAATVQRPLSRCLTITRTCSHWSTTPRG